MIAVPKTRRPYQVPSTGTEYGRSHIGSQSRLLLLGSRLPVPLRSTHYSLLGVAVICARYLSGPARNSLTSRTLSSSPYSTTAAGTSSNDTIVAPGYAIRIGE